MTYNDYHKTLLNEAVIDFREALKQKIKSGILSRGSNSHGSNDEGASINAITRYHKINNMLISGRVKAEDEVDFRVLGH